MSGQASVRYTARVTLPRQGSRRGWYGFRLKTSQSVPTDFVFSPEHSSLFSAHQNVLSLPNFYQRQTSRSDLSSTDVCKKRRLNHRPSPIQVYMKETEPGEIPNDGGVPLPSVQRGEHNRFSPCSKSGVTPVVSSKRTCWATAVLVLVDRTLVITTQTSISPQFAVS